MWQTGLTGHDITIFATVKDFLKKIIHIQGILKDHKIIVIYFTALLSILFELATVFM